MIFNRKVLYIGDSMQRLAEIRAILDKANIRYRAKVKDTYSAVVSWGYEANCYTLCGTTHSLRNLCSLKGL